MKTICLIDAENISHRKIDDVVKHIQKTNQLAEIRIFGDFSRRSMHGWNKCIKRHRMTKIDQPGAIAGKNSSDIALVVDAMDLLHTRRKEFECIALVTSDSDFAVLTRRLRKGNVRVIGYGEAKAPEAFRQKCTSYFEYGEALAENKEAKDLPSIFKKLLKLLKRAIGSLCNATGWARISNVGREVRTLNPSVSHRDFGARRFSDLFRHELLNDMFEVRKVGDSLEVKLA